MKVRFARIVTWTLGVVMFLGVAGYIAFQVSPWPSALIARYGFNKQAEKLSAALEKHIPSGVSAQRNQHYVDGDRDALLDVYYPSQIENSQRSLPTIVWVHGGGWVSGSKELVANYCKILAGMGYTVVAVEYSVAPGAIYPTPLRQVNAALSYLKENARRLHVDASHLVLAGDSGGALIAAQLANVISVPSYANDVGIVPTLRRGELIGLILYCGAYDVSWVHLDGPFGIFRKTLLWSYTGIKDYRKDPHFAAASVINYVTPDFPPAFISAGNVDPLAPLSHAFAEALAGHGVYVDTFFFPADYSPPLPHEYQFNLDTDAGRLALERSVTFVNALYAGSTSYSRTGGQGSCCGGIVRRLHGSMAGNTPR